MINLAHDEQCDIVILEELEKAGITAFKSHSSDKPHYDVPYTIFGGLGVEPLSEEDQRYFDRIGTTPEFAETMASFVFTRAWYYWCVSGFVPLSIAEEIYENPNGVKDIRVAGHCACPPPSEWLTHHKVCGMDVVDSYHIDTQEGLNYFVKTMIKHGLV